MPERDFIGDVVKYSFSGIIPIDDLYKALNKWTKAAGYRIMEKEHKTVASGEKSDHVLAWTLEKKATDYVRLKIDTDIKIKGMREVKTKTGKKKYHQGNVDFAFSAYLEKDYEDMYGKNPLVKFTREVFDKYVTESKMKTFEREIIKDRDKLITEIRAFLEVQKLKGEEEK
ncbi:MAG TPA: hypothetical protein VJH37_01850 [Candidatus Nanoarchaeia archaeon]|nr:hypothetical protein [Candidatus Nanoarchaeia archaeon]